MRLVTLAESGQGSAGIVTGDRVIPLTGVNESLGTTWPTTVLGLLRTGEAAALSGWLRERGGEVLSGIPSIPLEQAQLGPLYHGAVNVWGVGANFREKAANMAVVPPEMEPICFLKPASTMIGPGQAILLPDGAGRITAEAEIGLVIGRTCKHVSPEEAPHVIAGIVLTLDMTAQDVHARNPRFLGRSKSYDTFFSFGPELVGMDEIGDLDALDVQTVLNGSVRYRSCVSDMIYSPWLILSYFSRMMTLYPGDIIMTGTPGSVDIQEGDTAECRVGTLIPLRNPVVQERIRTIL
ncbi:2-keto-4-pentenoate hydratase/2-oxohepta-3-ene-1,7-dioic acid hydratase in catechol pathway [Paenibacillus rhizosphaerae]|uniref:2-keto-4-pentenoate hydratase/2-oxohepta-3-ene-1,7-dioic acid hydratase in catechol pathway n=1 Tax=Paenibacillus rhizosphaerae TaxID=297318 RepID=A0A839TN80_9BACL|nr:fumarylacetoacetate hydrolase family protein [Paenibacillus rhizosphaerae]MBB3127983.1 2-keto-4-pentenoate hydratase/2-oxohepta-3-ene-1,7-dioic acid hydratase in catechol pathway [Paenibacillus rhizosphaerae]